MSLTKRLLTSFIILYVLVAPITILISYENGKQEVYSEILSQYEEHFRIAENNFHVFFEDIKEDLITLSQIPAVTTPNDADFTSFLNADESTFEYHYSEDELEIIHLFNTYRISHPHVNSVYMGRENGSFVRSHQRTQPTKYDPRERPWYQIALESPNKIQMTQPYSSVTNPDINIATVIAIKDKTGKTLGVVGMDVTLNELSIEMGRLVFGYDGTLEFLDSQNVIIVSPEEQNLYQQRKPVLNSQIVASHNHYDLIKVGDNYEISYPTEIMDGKFIASIPAKSVKQIIWNTVKTRVIFITFIIFIVAVFTYLLVEKIILRPVRDMKSAMKTSQLEAIPQLMNIKATGEIQDFQNEYNKLASAIKQEKTELEKIKSLTVTSLVSLSEIRDHETGLHIIRTQKYVELLAVSYNKLFPDKKFSEYKLSIIVQCAPLHDIGKVAIPDHILLKPGKLSEEEFNIMKKHTTYGKDTIVKGNVELTDNLFIETVINIVYYHHERWNGSGYPIGLKTEEIPIEARIMAVADVYDALTSDRVYKNAISHEAAVAILKEGINTQFDPEIIQAFLLIEQTFKAICEFYSENQHPVSSISYHKTEI